MHQLSQQERLFILLVYIAILLTASRVVLGSFLPPTSEDGLWFYAGLASLLLGNLIVTPFFTKPADSISYSVSALVALLATYIVDDPARLPFEKILWIAVVVYELAVLVLATAAIVFRSSAGNVRRALGAEAFRAVGGIGEARWVYSAVFFLAVIVFHRDDAAEFATLLGVGLGVVILRPLEFFFLVAQRVNRVLRGLNADPIVGELIGRQEPGVILVRRLPGRTVKVGELLAIQGQDSECFVGMILDEFFLAGETWLRAGHVVMAELSEDERTALQQLATYAGSAAIIDAGRNQTIIDKLSRQPVVSGREQVVGLVAPDTDSNTLLVEVTRTDSVMEEGRLLQTRIGNKTVLYQVVAGVSREEVLRELNRYGYARARARKIGSWDQMKGKFAQVKWLPLVNEPVLLVDDQIGQPSLDAVGYVPKTAYPIGVDTQKLVTHNTAILGILGVGKTFLAFELIQRMQIDGIKVICLDITDEYGPELGFVIPPELQALYDKVAWGKGNHQQNKEEGGGVREFKTELKNLLDAFLANDQVDQRLLVLDPASFDVWEQTGGMFQGSAAMASLSPSEITRIITELTLQNLQAKGKSPTARACVIFEEAHSLVPEWNSAAVEGDQRAANGTAKSILQGRKYGLGCLLVTQRTANVTKTILNQCNTIFAMRSYDSTGIEYLRAHLGDDYTRLLSTLDDQHAVVFGKASSCADPVVIALNDRDQFKALLP
ncbi:MAG TPA: DUF87 domain-containing protein [Dehalococcoidia bacterium]|nr:DUF87 domain-containing protein [Dehalococcoidia bacterium]